jgi:cell division protein FtsB
MRASLKAPIKSLVAGMVALFARWRRKRATLSLEQRRARTMVVVAIAFAGIVLLTSFPIAGVLSQRSALSGTAHEVTTLQTENDTLSRQASDLADPAAVDTLARHDFGFVSAGQQAYDILPSPGLSPRVSLGTGQVPLNGPPVVPGSARSQALVGIAASAADAARGRYATNRSGSGGSGSDGSAEPRGYWARVVRSLEFWN